jgi:hypothetical protein
MCRSLTRANELRDNDQIALTRAREGSSFKVTNERGATLERQGGILRVKMRRGLQTERGGGGGEGNITTVVRG